MRVAAVDLGTNSTRLLVADVEDGRIADLDRETRITRLGEGVDERRRLLPVPIARVRNVLSSYRRELESLGAERTLCIATSAVRDPIPPINGSGIKKPNNARLGIVCITFAMPSTGPRKAR